MPEPGGLAAKYGSRYEDSWTVNCSFEVLQEKARAIRLEPSGPVGDGFEFVLEFEGRSEFHQVKRQRTGKGSWTLSALHQEGVLKHFFARLEDPLAWCCFISAVAAPELTELADRAGLADSYHEFNDVKLGSSIWRNNFEDLKRKWGCTDGEVVFDRLKRVRVVTIDEDQLSKSNVDKASIALHCLRPDIAVDSITSFLRGQAGRRIGSGMLWDFLHSAGFKANPIANPSVLVPKVKRANQSFIQSRKTGLIGGSLIEREESRELFDRLKTERLIVVSGPAGTGKSEVLLGLQIQLQNADIPHLAFRLDRIQPVGDQSSLGAQLGFNVSPHDALEIAAAGEFSVLVIDQLDTISTASGRNASFFECVRDLVRDALGTRSMRIVLACRSFDLENDSRLRSLIPKHGQNDQVLSVGSLDVETVLTAVQGFGIGVDELTSEQLGIVSVPLHLALLGETVSPNKNTGVGSRFADETDLFAAFWTAKRDDVRMRLGRDPHWTAVIDKLINWMSENEALSAPIDLLDEWSEDATAMVSCHLLHTDGSRVAFFHESFFDYVFARRFISLGGTVETLLESGQGLFKRSQVRQLLAYGRPRGNPYPEDLAFLLNDPGIRFHLRELVLAWLKELQDPREFEWLLLQRFLENVDSPFHRRAWNVVSAEPWFEFAFRSGFIQSCLKADDSRTDYAVDAICNTSNLTDERSAALLEENYEPTEGWANRIRWAFLQKDIDSKKHLLDLLLRFLNEGKIDQIGLDWENVLYAAHELSDKSPDRAIELVGVYLRSGLGLSASANEQMSVEAQVLRRKIPLADHLPVTSGRAPVAFLKEIWPCIHGAIESEPDRYADGSFRSSRWSPPCSVEDVFDLPGQLLWMAKSAFRSLAEVRPEEFRAVFREYDSCRLEAITELQFEGFGSNPSEFAEEAIRLISGDEYFLEIAQGWGTRRLLTSITPFAGQQSMRELERCVLQHYTAWERSAEGRSQFGESQMILLGGVAEEKMTERMNQRYRELIRKFGSEFSSAGRVSDVQVISPISSHATTQMSDDAWLSAFKSYDGPTNPEREIFNRGGASELAHELEREATSDPERFARLALKMDNSVVSAYFNAILRAVTSSPQEVPKSLSESLVSRCHELPGRPCGRWIVGPLRNHFDQPLSTEMVDVISWYAINGADPDSDWIEIDPDNDDHRRLIFRGRNTVQGAIAHEIAFLVSQCPSNRVPLLGALRRLAGDPSVAVRAMSLDAVAVLVSQGAEEAFDLFFKAIEHPRDELLELDVVSRIVGFGATIDFGRFASLIERMIRSPRPKCQREGGALATQIFLKDPANDALAKECIGGSEENRVGAARVFAANLGSTLHRDTCSSALRPMFSDPSKEVRKRAALLVSKLGYKDVGAHSELIVALVDSQAGSENWSLILEPLSKAQTVPPEVLIHACQIYLEHVQSTTGDVRRFVGLNGEYLGQMIIRAYANGSEAERNSSLDLLDLGLSMDLLVADQLLQHAPSSLGWPRLP